MNELKSILVQMDSSPRSQTRLELANQLALALGAAVTATKRSADILKQPLALTRKKKEGGEQAGEQHDGKTSSAVC